VKTPHSSNRALFVQQSNLVANVEDLGKENDGFWVPLYIKSNLIADAEIVLCIAEYSH
jgi:hypothetical protein